MAARFRVMDLRDEAAPRAFEGPEQVERPPAGVVRWVDVSGDGGTELHLLGERFGFHPLTIEDCLHFDQRPKLEDYGDYFFVVLHAFACPEADPRQTEAREVHAFLGKDYLVTVHALDVPPLEMVWKRIAAGASPGRREADFLYYQVTDAMVDANFPIVDRFTEQLEDIEDSVMARQNPADLIRIFDLKRTLVLMRKVLSPQRDVIAMLVKHGDSRISPKTALYFRDVFDHLVRICESIDANRDLLGNALDAYLSMASNRTNEIIKRLTLLSAVFLPLTFVTGFFGQNFEHLPFHSHGFMFVMLAACVTIPALMFIWFRRSGWF